MVFGGLVLAAVVLCAIAPDLLTGYDPEAVDPVDMLLPPGGDHLFGTDQLGRDIFSRVVHGARPSLVIGLAATALAVVAGSLMGMLAGFFGGWVDMVLMRVVDVLQAFPPLLLALAVVAVLGGGIVGVTLAVGVASVAGFARLMRAEVLRVRSRPFVEAATVNGVSRWSILGRHVVPNAMGPVAVLGVLCVGLTIFSASSLSFLGFGPKPPTAEWGALVAAGRDFISTAWWMTTFPGLAVALTVLAATMVSRSHDVAAGALR